MIKKFLLIYFLWVTGLNARAQHKEYVFYELYQLDSIGQSSSIGRHFGALYYDFLLLVEAELAHADTAVQRYLRNFEKVFARFYIDACEAYEKKQVIPLPAWRAYFSDSTLHASQYSLLGTNAHLNGGLAEAISHSYSPAEWETIKKSYVLFNKCLNRTYGWVYDETVTHHPRARTFSMITLGLTKPVGKYYLYKWRKRQMRLTEYFYTGSPKYEKLLQKVNRKKDRIDRMILAQLKVRD